MAVLYTPHFAQFFENDGVTPAAGGLLYTYAAGTTTPKATYTTAAGDIEHTNPIVLDSAGRAVIFISGSYKYVLKDSDGNTIKETDNVTSFNATTANTEGFFQSFSGDAATVAFTTSDSLGSDEKALMVFSELEYSTNGTFASDTGWTKGTGWTIAAGVATATGAISTALEQSAGITLIQGKQYLVQYTITRSAGTITPSLGGTAGTGRSASGTYSETIIAGSTQTISFGTSGFTGTVDNVSVRDLGGLTIRNVGDYTIDGTTLTFTKAPASGTNNIFVFAPYTLINAAGAAQTAADAAIAAAGSAEAAVNSVAYQFTFDSSTTMADPGTGDFRLNNATLSSVTAIAVDALSSVAGNPDVSDAIAAWGASTSTNKGQIKITKSGTPATYALYNVTAAVTDNTGWLQITVAHVASNGTLTAADVCYLQHSRTGDKGDTGTQGPTGTISGATSQTAVTNDKALFLDTSSGDALSFTTVQDLITTSGVINGATSATVALNDEILFGDVSNSNAIRKALVSDLVPPIRSAAIESTVASASTVDLGAQLSPVVNITGTTTITSFGTAAAGTRREIRPQGVFIITHNATSLITPTGSNITTAVGQVYWAHSLGSGNWRIDQPSPSASGIALQSSVATTSGTSVDLSTSIPSGVNRITISVSGLSTTGTSPPMIQLGGGSYVTTGYSGANTIMTTSVATANHSSGFLLAPNTSNWAAGNVGHGFIELTRLSGNIWAAQGIIGRSDAAASYVLSGTVDLGATLARARLTTLGGSETFDAGSASISWEF